MKRTESKPNIIQAFRRISQKLPSSWHYQFEVQDWQVRLIRKLYEKNGFQIVQTASAFPEQYEVFKDGVQLAYYRLRDGEFTIESPDVGGELIFQSFPDGDGLFDKDERFIYMVNAMRLILSNLSPPSTV